MTPELSLLVSMNKSYETKWAGIDYSNGDGEGNDEDRAESDSKVEPIVEPSAQDQVLDIRALQIMVLFILGVNSA